MEQPVTHRRKRQQSARLRSKRWYQHLQPRAAPTRIQNNHLPFASVESLLRRVDFSTRLESIARATRTRTQSAHSAIFPFPELRIPTSASFTARGAKHACL